MIQLSNNIAMFATSTDQADKTYFFSIGIFLCPDESIVSNDIRLSIPYTQSLLKGMNCLLGRRWEETAFLVSIHFKFISSMTKQDEICNAGNNSTRIATSAHETSKYSTPELQSAYDTGRSIGRTEGMIAYQKHLIENIQKENVKLVQKLDLQKGGEV